MYKTDDYAKDDDKELIEVLLDFIIVSANLSKKINRVVKHRQSIAEGRNSYVENE